jgi:hypothetical protein
VLVGRVGGRGCGRFVVVFAVWVAGGIARMRVALRHRVISTHRVELVNERRVLWHCGGYRMEAEQRKKKARAIDE